MRVCIYTGNHGNSVGIGDLVGLLRNGARDCGYDAFASAELLPGHCNILIEHFIDEASLRHLLERKTPDTRYVLIGTETITGDTFNGGMVQQHWHYSNAAYWQARFEGFRFATRLADAIWVLAEPALPDYAALVPGKPVRFLPHGWASGLALVPHRDEADKDIDFCFTGTLTPYRQEILARLARQHRVLTLPQATPDYLRLDAFARTKVALSLRLSPDNQLPSVSRMHFHLSNRNFLVHEAYPQLCPLDGYVLHAPADDLVDWARAALDVPNRREIADGVLARFRTEMPMARLLKPLLAEAMGHAAAPKPISLPQAA